MLGEGLICVWQAAFARTIEKERDIDFADDLKCITKQVFSALSDKTFSEEEFACIIKHGYASFQDFKAYIMKKLQDDDVPDYLQIAAIEEECWKLSKGAYKSNIPEKSLKKLWQIANRLTLANSYRQSFARKNLNCCRRKLLITCRMREAQLFSVIMRHFHSCLFTWGKLSLVDLLRRKSSSSSMTFTVG